jgi:hypothetical protein
MFRLALAAARTVALLALPCLATPALARTWQVAPDGTGDAPTIQAAVDSAGPGDVVELACGTYSESDIHLVSGITLRSAGGPECAVIGGPGAAVLVCDGVDGTTIQAVTLAGAPTGATCTDSSPWFRTCAFTGNGRGVLATGGAPVFEGCLFVSNHSDGGGGIQAVGSSVTLTGCDFRDNWAFRPGVPGGSAEGGGIWTAGGSLTANGCTFTNNFAGGGTSAGGWGAGGAVSCSGAGYFADCVFTGNSAAGISGGSGAAVYGGTSFDRCVFLSNGSQTVVETTGTLSNSLLAGNVGPMMSGSIVRCTIVGGSGAGVGSAGGLTVESSIVAFHAGAAFVGADVTVSCSNVFDNRGGDWVNGAAGQGGLNGNLSCWPLFCDPESGNYWLSAGSRCLAPNNSCGVQIGACGQGCGPVGLEDLSWGRIKGMYQE